LALHTSFLTYVASLSNEREVQTRERTFDNKKVFFVGLFCGSLLALHTSLLTYVATEVQSRERTLDDN